MIMEKKVHQGVTKLPFINKALSKKFMKMSNPRNKHLKSRGEEDRQSYAKKEIYAYLRKIKRSFYSTLNEKMS